MFKSGYYWNGSSKRMLDRIDRLSNVLDVERSNTRDQDGRRIRETNLTMFRVREKNKIMNF